MLKEGLELFGVFRRAHFGRQRMTPEKHVLPAEEKNAFSVQIP